jgi:uncharacterized protein YuzE
MVDNRRLKMLKVDTDPKADAVYITLLDEPVGYSKELDANRIIDCTINPGKAVGIDLLSVSKGVKITDLPEAEAVEKILKGLGIKIVK